MLKTTPFTNFHIEAGAKMLPFAGYNMPVEYSGIKDEHLTVRNAVGVFDVSHMGEIWVKGSGALAFLQKLTSNDVGLLKLGQAQYSYFPNYKGGIVDDLLVYYYEPEKYMLVVNASNIDKDFEWLKINNDNKDVEIENASDNIAQLAIQGPLALATLQKLTTSVLSEIKYFNFITTELAGVVNVIVSATGYTGAGGFELYFYKKHAPVVWNALFAAGKEFGIKPIGLGARDTLRLEMGYCLYGNDIDDASSPIEAGLGWVTKLNEQKNLIAKEIIVKQKNQGVSKRLRGFKLIDKGIPRNGYEIFNKNNEKVGEVTSGSISPVLGIGIGMGYISSLYASIGSEIFIKIRNNLLRAEIVKLPFM
jgi:aminomethyltransferase